MYRYRWSNQSHLSGSPFKHPPLYYSSPALLLNVDCFSKIALKISIEDLFVKYLGFKIEVLD